MPPDDAALSWVHATLLAACALLCASIVTIAWQRARADRDRTFALGLGALTLASLALRLWLSPHGPVHENYHAADALDALLFGPRFGPYGEAGPALYRALASLFGPSSGGVFATSAVVAALAPAALAAADLALTGRRARALFAGLLLAASPLHLRYSAGDDLFGLALTFALVAVACAALFLRTGSALHGLAAALAAGLAASTRPELLVLPVLLVAVAALHSGSARRLRSREFALAVLVALVVVAPRLATLVTGASGEAPALAPPELARFVTGHALFDPALHGPPLFALLALGVAHGLAVEPRLFAWRALGALGFGALALAFFDSPTANPRLQLLALPFGLMVAASGAEALALALRGGLRAPWGGRIAWSGALVLAAAAFDARLPLVTERGHDQREWAFLSASIPRLPSRGELLAPLRPGERTLATFPTLLLEEHAKALRGHDLGDASASGRWPSAEGTLIYYEGLHCYFAFLDEPAPAPLRPACEAVRAHYGLEPMSTIRVPPTRLQTFRYARDGREPFELGFYRLHARPGGLDPNAPRPPPTTASPEGPALAVIPAGEEGRVKALLRPLALGGEIAGGVRAAGLRIARDHVRLELRRGDEDAGHVEIHLARQAPPEARRCGLLALIASSDAPAAIVAGLAEILASRTESELPWSRPRADLPAAAEPRAGDGAPIRRSVRVPWRRASLLALMAFAAWAAAAHVTRRAAIRPPAGRPRV